MVHGRLSMMVGAEKPDSDSLDTHHFEGRPPFPPNLRVWYRPVTHLTSGMIPVPIETAHVSSPVGTCLFSLAIFIPAPSAMVSISAAKSFCRYACGSSLNVAA